VQTCIWPSWCHCHSLSLTSVKSRFVLEKGPLNVCAFPINYLSTSAAAILAVVQYVHDKYQPRVLITPYCRHFSGSTGCLLISIRVTTIQACEIHLCRTTTTSQLQTCIFYRCYQYTIDDIESEKIIQNGWQGPQQPTRLWRCPRLNVSNSSLAAGRFSGQVVTLFPSQSVR